MSSASTWLHCDGAPELLFTENESNAGRLWGQPNASPYVKDAFHEYVISGRGEAVNPAKAGTKAAAQYALDVPAGGSKTIRLRLAAARVDKAFSGFEEIFKRRVADADEFYDRITPGALTEDQRRVHRQALAGMLWSKQYLLLRSGSMAPGAPESSATRIRPAGHAQYGLVSHAERRHHLDAG